MQTTKLFFLTLLLLQPECIIGMQLSSVPIDIWPAIIKYAASESLPKHDPIEEEKYVYAKNAEWTRQNEDLIEYKQKRYRTKVINTHARNTMIKHHTLQLVCKDLRRMFWDCFTEQEKDAALTFLLKKEKFIPCLVDIAVSMQASMNPILSFCLREREEYYLEDAHAMNLEYMRAILAIDNAKAINGTYPDHIGSFLRQSLFYCADDIVALLLNCPMVDVNATNPLNVAMSMKSLEINKLFLSRPDINVNAVDGRGETVLFYAGHRWTKEKFSIILDLLIKAGIDSTIKDKDGKTVFDVARSTWKPEMVAILEQAFAQKEKNL
jgi:hypothetical protein